MTACLTIMLVCGLFATSAMKQPAQAVVDAQSKTAVEDEAESAYAEEMIRAAEIALGELDHAAAKQEEAIRAVEDAREDVSKDETAVSEMLQVEDAVLSYAKSRY